MVLVIRGILCNVVVRAARQREEGREVKPDTTSANEDLFVLQKALSNPCSQSHPWTTPAANPMAASFSGCTASWPSAPARLGRTSPEPAAPRWQPTRRLATDGWGAPFSPDWLCAAFAAICADGSSSKTNCRGYCYCCCWLGRLWWVPRPFHPCSISSLILDAVVGAAAELLVPPPTSNWPPTRLVPPSHPPGHRNHTPWPCPSPQRLQQ